jgi:1-acyl-sn-glycerol-3-phosphate acyltransferase
LKITGIKTQIRGIENIDRGRTYIIIANHQSHFDILALISTLGIQFRWVAKRELLKVPVFGQGLYLARAIFVDRTNKRRAIESIRDGINGLPKGVSVIFFAEGTRSPDGKIRPFKKGGFMAALATGTPILPVTIKGSRDVMPKGSIVYHRGCLEVVVGKPIDSKGFDKKEINDLMDLTRGIIISNFKA